MSLHANVTELTRVIVCHALSINASGSCTLRLYNDVYPLGSASIRLYIHFFIDTWLPRWEGLNHALAGYAPALHNYHIVETVWPMNFPPPCLMPACSEFSGEFVWFSCSSPMLRVVSHILRFLRFLFLRVQVGEFFHYSSKFSYL